MGKAKLIEIGKVASAVAAISAVIYAVVLCIAEVGSFKSAVEQNTEEVRALRRDFNAHSVHESELITQIRIAVASLEAAQRYASAATPPTMLVPGSNSSTVASSSLRELARARAALGRLDRMQFGADDALAAGAPSAE